jgi:hypothetical protein
MLGVWWLATTGTWLSERVSVCMFSTKVYSGITNYVVASKMAFLLATSRIFGTSLIKTYPISRSEFVRYMRLEYVSSTRLW